MPPWKRRITGDGLDSGWGWQTRRRDVLGLGDVGWTAGPELLLEVAEACVDDALERGHVSGHVTCGRTTGFPSCLELGVHDAGGEDALGGFRRDRHAGLQSDL
jgi:hypothetical protein